MSNDDKTPLTFWDIKVMTEEEINANWEEVSKVMTEQGKVKEEDDDA